MNFTENELRDITNSLMEYGKIYLNFKIRDCDGVCMEGHVILDNLDELFEYSKSFVEELEGPGYLWVTNKKDLTEHKTYGGWEPY